MKRSGRWGFAHQEFMAVIALFACGVAFAQPVFARSYSVFLSHSAATGASPGWLQHLQAVGYGAAVAGVALLGVALVLKAVIQGREMLAGFRTGLVEAVSDLKRHWRNRP